MDKLIAYFSSKSPKEILIVLLVIVVGIWVVKKFVFPEVKKIIKQITPPKPNDGSDPNLTDAREAYLRDLATELFDAYSCIFCSNQDAIEAISKSLALNDSELIVLNKYYHEQGENTLYYDTDWEIMPNTEVDDRLLAKLEELNISLK